MTLTDLPPDISSPPTRSVLEHALDYARRGWLVVPQRAKDRPIRGWLQLATIDEPTIKSWFSDARYQPAIITGPSSNLLVIDIDPRSGGDSSFSALINDLGDPGPTYEVATGGGGRHLYYADPGVDVRHRLPTAPGVDFLGAGRKVTAPPAKHASGRRYSIVRDMDVAQLPAAWTVAIAKAVRPAARPDGVRPRLGTDYGMAALTAEVDAIGGAPEGNRNETLNRAAYNLGQLVAARELDADLVRQHLTVAGLKVGLTSAEVTATIKSGMTAGAASPRRLRQRRSPSTSEGGTNQSSSASCDYRLTDLGNAERLADQHRERLRYVPEWRAWIVWDGRRWHRDAVDHGTLAAKATVRGMDVDVSALQTRAMAGDQVAAARAELLARWQRRSESARSLRAMRELAETELSSPSSDYDTHPLLFTVANGTVDLTTGKLGPHRPEHMITQLADVTYHPAATCPLWESFLLRVQPDDAVREWLQRLIGYWLTGHVSEQILAVFLGAGANGKSTLVSVIQHVMGDYAAQGSHGLLLAQERGGDEVGRRHRVVLRDHRLVAVQEIDEGRYWAEAQLKQITGGDKITAARVYENEVSFTPTAKIVVAANSRPRVGGVDEGIWRRLRLVPFPVVVPEADRDPDLLDKLKTEASGILAWAVRGAVAWRQFGLGPTPQAITDATHDYRIAEDVIGEFIDC
ncbi:MAG: bifunctional DNA primase/polymerase [Myxococcales bacterium]|nr:bifunctional DNA primase/polymerase [Myxococcales bacterium]